MREKGGRRLPAREIIPKILSLLLELVLPAQAYYTLPTLSIGQSHDYECNCNRCYRQRRHSTEITFVTGFSNVCIGSIFLSRVLSR